MHQEHRDRATRHLEALRTLLGAHADRDVADPLVELCDHLERAIAAFHMEAIRFRMYTLGKQMHRPDLQLPPEALAHFDEMRHALEAAGFQTRSITS